MEGSFKVDSQQLQFQNLICSTLVLQLELPLELSASPTPHPPHTHTHPTPKISLAPFVAGATVPLLRYAPLTGQSVGHVPCSQ